MTDFLDRYGEQLRWARKRRRRRLARASVLAVIVPVAAAVVVLVIVSAPPDVERPASPRQQPTATATATATLPAASGTWTPRVGRPDKKLPATIDRTPVAPAAVAAFAVLRRPQTERDRKLALPLLRYAGGPIDGVQVDGVRALGSGYALIPVTKFGPNLGAGLCVAGHGGSGCGQIERAPRTGVSTESAGPDSTHFVGVVPDGVVRVRFTPDGGAPIETTVRDNFYELRTTATGKRGRIDPPKGYTGRTGPDGKIEAPPMPAHGRLEWIDAAGNVVKQGP